MKYSQTAGIFGVLLIVFLCYMPWSYVAEDNLVFTGMNAGDNYGKPAILHFVFGAVLILFFLIPKIWAKRTNIFIAAINLAWGIKNFILMGACFMGVCPERKVAIWLVVIVSAFIQLTTFFPNIKVPKQE